MRNDECLEFIHPYNMSVATRHHLFVNFNHCRAVVPLLLYHPLHFAPEYSETLLDIGHLLGLCESSYHLPWEQNV